MKKILTVIPCLGITAITVIVINPSIEAWVIIAGAALHVLLLVLLIYNCRKMIELDNLGRNRSTSAEYE